MNWPEKKEYNIKLVWYFMLFYYNLCYGVPCSAIHGAVCYVQYIIKVEWSWVSCPGYDFLSLS